MGIIDSIVLAALMVALAAMPSSSVALVVARSASLGVPNGFAVAAGIVLGDLLFIALALLGLSYVAELMGSFFVILKYLGAAYLIWLGVSLLRALPSTGEQSRTRAGSGTLLASFAAGFLLTLGDVKAIVFYASVFPLLVDPAALSSADVLVIGSITIVTVGGVKCVYALVAERVAGSLARRVPAVAIKRALGGALVAAGTAIAVKA